jgi:predicted molibdopterin-dependent oxidoreductase YjgC
MTNFAAFTSTTVKHGDPPLEKMPGHWVLAKMGKRVLRPGGLDYDDAIQVVAKNIERIQSQYGLSSMAVLSGASLTTEKAYLMGKFARMCLKTSNIDYNGRLCMVSAGAANKKAFGIDRAANPWSDITKADVVWISGANVAECAPITTSYVWQAREYGAKIIVVDPRITPIAARAIYSCRLSRVATSRCSTAF